jgi:lysozyme
MINAEGLALIKKSEGCALKPYLCPAGVPTQGWGRTKGITIKSPEITREVADQWLIEDLEFFEDGVLELVTFEKLNENQFAALVSFAYNLGLGKLKGSTLLKLLNDDKPLQASKEFGKWVYANKKKLSGLVKRREAERKLFLTPALVVDRKKR